MIDVRSRILFFSRKKLRVSYTTWTLQSEQADEWHMCQFVDSAGPFTSWCHVVNERPDIRSSRSSCEISANVICTARATLAHRCIGNGVSRQFACANAIRNWNVWWDHLLITSVVNTTRSRVTSRFQTARVFRGGDHSSRDLASSPNSTITFESWQNCCVDRKLSPTQQKQATATTSSLMLSMRTVPVGRPLRPRTLQLYAETDDGHKHRVDGFITSWCEMRVWKRDVRQSVLCLTRDRVLRSGMDSGDVVENWRAILDDRICSARVWRTSWLTSTATFQLQCTPLVNVGANGSSTGRQDGADAARPASWWMHWVRKHPACAHSQPLKAVRSQEVAGSGPRETTSSMEDMCMLEVKVTPKNNPDGHVHLYLKRSGKFNNDDIYIKIFVCTNSMELKIRTWEHETKTIKLQIWDTAGQQLCRTITSSHHSDTHDITLLSSNRTRRQRRVPPTTTCQIWRQPMVTKARKQNRSEKRTNNVLSFTCHGMGFCAPTLEKFPTFIYHWSPVCFERITFDWLANLGSCDLRVVNEPLDSSVSAGNACVPWESYQDTHVCCWVQDDPAADRQLVCSCVTLVCRPSGLLVGFRGGQVWLHPLRPNRPAIIGLRSTRCTAARAFAASQLEQRSNGGDDGPIPLSTEVLSDACVSCGLQFCCHPLCPKKKIHSATSSKNCSCGISTVSELSGFCTHAYAFYGNAHHHPYSSFQCAFDVLGFDAFIRIVLVFPVIDDWLRRPLILLCAKAKAHWIAIGGCDEECFRFDPCPFQEKIQF